MRAYDFVRLTEYPDAADLRAEGRPCRRKNKASKRASRRYIKRSNRARDLRYELTAE